MLMGAGADQLARPQPMELVRLRIQLGSVGLVRQIERGLVDLSDPPRDLFVQRRDARSRIDDKQNQVGRIHRGGDLLLDLARQVVHVVDADPARVDNLEEPVVHLDQVRDAIPRDARHVVNNR